jgi:hypothetical protein
VPATPDADDAELDAVAEAVIENPPLVDKAPPTTFSEPATKTLADALQEFSAGGVKPSITLAQSQSAVLNNFFDDEDD